MLSCYAQLGLYYDSLSPAWAISLGVSTYAYAYAYAYVINNQCSNIAYDSLGYESYNIAMSMSHAMSRVFNYFELE
eukprot:scaffold11876_cov98-Skeletonema_dohrnii-CCMP3373.AAC.2